MTRGGRGAIVALALGSVLAPRAALGQGASPPSASGLPAPSSAREHVSAGDRLRRLHMGEVALASYRAAYALEPSNATLRRIADLARELGDTQEAIDAYERLQAAPDAARDGHRRAAEQALEVLRAESGTLVVATEAEGADVFVDGRRVATTPMKPTYVSARRHLVRVEREGLVPVEQAVEISPGAATEVRTVLVAVAMTGAVYVVDRADRAIRVALDGKEIGVTPITVAVEPGPHAVTIADPNLRGAPVSTTVAVRERTSVVVDAASVTGRLTVEASPPGAKVLVDGAAYQGPSDLGVGAHEVVVAAEGYVSQTHRVELRSEEAHRLRVDLVRERAAQRGLRPQPPPREHGGHLDIGLFPAFALHERFVPCGGAAGCAEQERFAGGLLLRGGYEFGAVGFSITALPFGYVERTSEAPLEHVTATVGGIVTVGPTISSSGRFVRVAAGLGGGVGVWRVVTLSSSDTAVSLAGDAHVGLLLGSSPGAKLELGGRLLVLSENLSAPSGASGAVQLFLGPYLGGRFGY